MTGLLAIFVSDIFPIFAIAGAGYLLARYLSTSVKTLSHVVFYAALPCLVFRLLVTSTETGQAIGRTVLITAAVIGAVGGVGYLTARTLGLDRASVRAFLIVVMFSNAGNYGLPVLRFAYGDQALAYGAIVFLTGSVLTYTVGGFLAAGARSASGTALLRVLRMPALYGVALAALVLTTGATVPAPVMRPVTLLGDAALPLMILILGMQLERAVMPARPVVAVAAVLVSLIAAPIIALGVTSFLDVTGPARQAIVTLSSMPVAVATTILALEFDLDPDFVTSTVFLSTLVSPLTLTPLIAYLR